MKMTQEPHEPVPRLSDLLEYLAQPGSEHVWAFLDVKVTIQLSLTPTPIYTCNVWRTLTQSVNKQRPRHHPRNRQNNRLHRTTPEPPLAHPPHPRLLVLSLHPPDHHPPPILLHGPRLLRPPRRSPLLSPPQPRGLQCEPAGVDGSAGPWVSGRCAQSE